MTSFTDILHGKSENHILPFLWVHGETEQEMRDEILHIYKSGIRSLCVEARPHSDFNGPKWFSDLSFILNVCKELGMKMWLLDDSHFPTGFANGEVAANHKEYCKKFLHCKALDFAGPVQDTSLVLRYSLQSPEDDLIGVYAYKKSLFEGIDSASVIDLTPFVSDGCVNVNLEEGEWTICVVSVSYKGGEQQTEGYLNPLVKEATQILLDTVYQKVYDHLGQEFGKTFMGFFSDEPRFGNIHGAENAAIGKNSQMNLPWCDGLENILLDKINSTEGILKSVINKENICSYLACLFLQDDRVSSALQYIYMDTVSQMYSDNFDGAIADWCHKHNCLHIGHTVEDNEASSRLGYGAGHIFRSMKNADMAGIDVVIHQLMPGMDKTLFKGMHNPGWDGEFFTYLLGKFGGSIAHLDANKQGRCMCELFGAYSWAEGNRLEKWLCDYMLVRGVNYLVPHAFDCAPFPNRDCPPHLYADGHNPQYPEFKLLMKYCNSLTSLLSDGKPLLDAALFFNAEGEWSGEYQNTKIAARILTQNQINFDLVSMDHILEGQCVNNKLVINNITFNVLVLPYSKKLPIALLKKLTELKEQGLKIVFTESIPEASTEGESCIIEYDFVKTESLAEYLNKLDICRIRFDKPNDYFRYYCYQRKDEDIIFMTNEGKSKSVTMNIKQIKDNSRKYVYLYDAMKDKLYKKEDCLIELEPYSSVTLVYSDICLDEDTSEVKQRHYTNTVELNECTVKLYSYKDLEEGAIAKNQPYEEVKLDELKYISQIKGFEDFSGRIVYEFEYCADSSVQDAILCLNGATEGACLKVNGIESGTVICEPYSFENIKLNKGINKIELELNTSLGRAMKDWLSQFMLLDPTGITGVKLNY